MVVFATGFAWVWLMQRKTQHALLLGCACILFAAALALQVLSWPADVAQNAMAAGILYTLAVLFACEGILQRSGKRLGATACLAIFAAMSALLWTFAYASPNLLARIYLQNFGYGAILLLTAIRLVPNRRQRWVDQVVFRVLFIFALHFFPRTLLTAGFSMPDGRVAASDSAFWIMLQFSLAVFGAALALAILAAILTDVMDELKDDRNRDGLTGILNRRGFVEADRHLYFAKQSGRNQIVMKDPQPIPTPAGPPPLAECRRRDQG